MKIHLSLPFEWLCTRTRFKTEANARGGTPLYGLMGTCGQPGYVFRDFCLEQGIEFIIFCLNQGIDLSICVLNWVKCLKQGIKNWNSVLKWIGKSAIFVFNRVRVWGAAPHLPTQGYIEYPPPPRGQTATRKWASISVRWKSHARGFKLIHSCWQPENAWEKRYSRYFLWMESFKGIDRGSVAV